MKVRELMARDLRTCAPDDNLDRAAQLMWEGDFGVVPVLGSDGTVIGMITDRDICMAAYTKGRALASLRVKDVMAKQVAFCSPESTLETAMSLMKETRVRRLPVVDAQGKLAGILSLNDIARAAREQVKSGGRELRSADVAETLGVLCEPRLPTRATKKSAGKQVGALVGSAI